MSIGGIPARRPCCWYTVAGTIAGAGTGTARALARDWHVLAPDLRGHGDSDWSPDGTYSMSAFVYDLAQLIHQLELQPVTIVGHSLGGSISLRYTGLYADAVAQTRCCRGHGAGDRNTSRNWNP